MGVTGGCRRDNRKSSAPEVLTLPHQTKKLGPPAWAAGLGLPRGSQGILHKSTGVGHRVFFRLVPRAAHRGKKENQLLSGSV